MPENYTILDSIKYQPYCVDPSNHDDVERFIWKYSQQGCDYFLTARPIFVIESNGEYIQCGPGNTLLWTTDGFKVITKRETD